MKTNVPGQRINSNSTTEETQLSIRTIGSDQEGPQQRGPEDGGEQDDECLREDSHGKGVDAVKQEGEEYPCQRVEQADGAEKLADALGRDVLGDGGLDGG